MGEWIEGERPGDGHIRQQDNGLWEFQIERFIARPIEKAWAALTIPERLAEWLGPIADLDLRLGGRFIVMFDREGDDGVRGTIVEFDPPRVLAFDWNEQACDLRCRFELAPEASGCRLTFSAAGLRETTPGMQVRFVPGSSAGWRLFMDELVKVITGVLPEGGDQPFEDAEKRYIAHFGPYTTGWDAPVSLRSHESQPFVTQEGDGVRKVRFSRIFGLPAAKVWAALTEPTRLARWYGPARIDARRDGEVAFETPGGTERGFIVDLVPDERVVWALPATDGRHTVFHFEVSPWTWPTTTVTRFVLNVRGVPERDTQATTETWMQRLHDLADAAATD